MQDQAAALVANAVGAERAGRAQEAARLWEQLASGHPQHPQALMFRARQRLEKGDPGGAAGLVAQAEQADGGRDPDIPMFAGLIFNQANRLDQAVAAFDRALAIDPYFLLAMLAKGGALERMGRPKPAAVAFENALKVAPPPERLPPHLRQQLEHAKRVVEAKNEGLAAHLRTSVAAQRQAYAEAGEDLRRFDEALDIYAGVRKRFVAEPVLFYMPRVPAIPFYDRAHFPWLEQVEAASDDIRAELEAVLREDMQNFAPYIQFPPGAPVNQWAKLNHSPAWTTYFLWRNGVKDEANCARCPKTTALLDAIPLAHQPGFGPNVVFSLLQPHTQIPPHTGSSNARLIGHLPLIIPEKCRFRVGNETREWKMGEAFIFDDSIEHEAWNDSDEIRVVMIFDAWNPYLTEAERALISTIMQAHNAY